MRRILFYLLVFTIIASGSKGLASTDCEKWLAEYKRELTQKATVQRALNAREHARRYAKRKLAQLIAPAAVPGPKPVRIASTRPHLTPAQMLKRFDLLCGDLPMEAMNQVLDGRMAPDEFISEMAMGGPVDAEVLPPIDTLLASEDAPPYVPVEVSSGGAPNAPFFPVYGPLPTGGGFGGTPILTTPPVVPVAPAVPEPSSILLLLTGAIGVAAPVWRRRRSA